jgi:hypothetical protein
MGVAEFCRRRTIPQSSFFAWRRRLLREDPCAAASGFVQVTTVPAEPGDGGIELHLAHDRHLVLRRHFDPQMLRELLAVLESEVSPAEGR